jgi:hypothetical protein
MMIATSLGDIEEGNAELGSSEDEALEPLALVDVEKPKAVIAKETSVEIPAQTHPIWWDQNQQ